jgi:hypothetical protein
LVQWKRLPVNDATWENTQELRDKFVNINLEDKVSVTRGSIDKPKRSLRVHGREEPEIYGLRVVIINALSMYRAMQGEGFVAKDLV